MEDEINDLFAIDISSDESSSATKVPRDQQTEADFLALKKTWRPKIEQGEVFLTLSPLTFLSTPNYLCSFNVMQSNVVA